MQTTTVLLIILAAVVAILIVLFQYFHKSKTRGKLRLLLSFLRFIALFSAFLLLVNPKFAKKDFTLERSNLLVLADNSSSIKNIGAALQIDSILQKITSSNKLSEKFNVEQFRFGVDIGVLDSLDQSDKATNIVKALKSLNTIYGNSESAIILLSDGNSTLGEDYEYYSENQKFPIYPIVLGDTARYDDLGITQVNTNKYAFLQNRFPVEIFVSYDGNENVSTDLSITLDGNRIHSQKLNFTKDINSKVLNINVLASSVGLKTMTIDIEPLVNEKNKKNNFKNVAIEVIDEKTNVAIVSDLLHPDVGALKKSIESNEQRSVRIVKPGVDLKELDDIDLFVLYQPTISFNRIFDLIDKVKSNSFLISGPKTDWNFLNNIQNSLTKNSYDQKEEVTPVINPSFSKFDISSLVFDNYPPLETNLGEVIINKGHEVLLGQRIKGTEIGEPLLVLTESGLDREAILFGENLWKWRVQNYRENQNFNDFDDLIGKIVFYLTLNETRSRLILNYQSFYEGNSEAKIAANYFDESYSFDPDAMILLSLKQTGESNIQEFPMLLKGDFYEADLSNMPSGEYTFTVKVVDENISKSGSFRILDFDVEQQFTSSNYKKLDRIAQSTAAELYFPDETNELINDLINEDKYKPVQKSHQNVVSLVDFRFLLGIIVVALAAEWFIRKYNGLT
ncbi:MAG: VWA domain-containing protein [Maribacter sp.]|nr:VWA domain-containing protein [Maribacter sp.]